MDKKKNMFFRRSLVVDVLYDLAGALLFGLGINCFTAPNNIAPGGITGLSTVIHYLTGFPIGTMSLLLNIPLFIMAYRFIGRRFALNTLKSLVIVTLMIDVVLSGLPVYVGDRILASLFGGLFIGVGMALILLRGSTTGGSDIIGILIRRRYPHIQLGRALLMVDAVVILISAAVYRDIESALYGAVSVFTCSKMIDTVLYGLDTGQMLMIVSNRHDEIQQAILAADRGVTALRSTSPFSGKDGYVLMCAVRKTHYSLIKQIVHEIDPAAFMVVCTAGEIFGEGFKDIKKE